VLKSQIPTNLQVDKATIKRLAFLNDVILIQKLLKAVDIFVKH
jgi:hypothetical protein